MSTFKERYTFKRPILTLLSAFAIVALLFVSLIVADHFVDHGTEPSRNAPTPASPVSEKSTTTSGGWTPQGERDACKRAVANADFDWTVQECLDSLGDGVKE